MRQLLFLACFFFVTAAVADDKLDTKELDKSSTNTSTTTTATDYNSSRSNNIHGAVPAGGPADDEDDAESPTTRAQDYNSSRSNTTSLKEDRKDLHKDNVVHRDVATRNVKTDDEDASSSEHHGEDSTVRKRPGK